MNRSYFGKGVGGLIFLVTRLRAHVVHLWLRVVVVVSACQFEEAVRMNLFLFTYLVVICASLAWRASFQRHAPSGVRVFWNFLWGVRKKRRASTLDAIKKGRMTHVHLFNAVKRILEECGPFLFSMVWKKRRLLNVPLVADLIKGFWGVEGRNWGFRDIGWSVIL